MHPYDVRTPCPPLGDTSDAHPPGCRVWQVASSRASPNARLRAMFRQLARLGWLVSLVGFVGVASWASAALDAAEAGRRHATPILAPLFVGLSLVALLLGCGLHILRRSPHRPAAAQSASSARTGRGEARATADRPTGRRGDVSSGTATAGGLEGVISDVRPTSDEARMAEEIMRAAFELSKGPLPGEMPSS